MTSEQLNGGINHSRIVAGLIVVSAGTFLAVSFWRAFNSGHLDDDASQLCRLVSPRRSKDDDKRVQLKRRRGSIVTSLKGKIQCDSCRIVNVKAGKNVKIQCDSCRIENVKAGKNVKYKYFKQDNVVPREQLVMES